MARAIRPRRRDYMKPVRYAVIALVVLAIVFGHGIVRLLTDWQWFGELHQRQVFTTTIAAKLTLYFGFGLLFFIIAMANFWYARHRSAADPRPRLLDAEREQIAAVAGVVARWGAVVAAVVLAFAVGGNAATHWSEYLLYTHAQSFAQTDPIFRRDIGFYVFRLPFLNYLQGLLLFTLFVTALGTTLIYYALRGVDLMSGLVPVLPMYARRHILGLCALLACGLAWRQMLARYDLLFSPAGPFFGAGYTDIHSRLPALTVEAIAWLIVAVLCIVNMQRGKAFLLPGIGLGAWVVLAIVASGLWPAMMQQFEVVPNQFDKERPYLAYDLDMTRKAYGLDKVQVHDIANVSQLTNQDLQRDSATVDNIRLWDWPQLGAVYDAKQALSTYYRFTLPAESSRLPEDFNIDVDRYRIGGAERQVMVGVRELLTDALPDQAKTWQNLHLIYTHGYGIVMSPVNVVDPEGLPDYYVSDIPIVSTVPGLKVDRPQIYYGERTQNTVYVDGRQKEFDRPSETGNVENRYDGTGGVLLGGTLNRTLWSMRLGDVNLLLSSDLTRKSRILYRRGIRQRVEALAPMLNWDNDPYMVDDNGRLVWILDGYTTSSEYPYSQPVDIGTGSAGVEQQFNYIRNSVKAVIDAYNGSVVFYVYDEKDPILRAYQTIFPHLFTSAASMSDTLRRHVRYPEDVFRIQRDIYSTYHVTSPSVYYSKEDQWAVPSEPTSSPDQGTMRMSPYYVNMRLPGENTQQFLLMTPFTPMSRQNLSSWMCAMCDPEDYGTLVVFRYPKGVVVNGPSQVMSTINAQGEISKTVSLLDQRGSRVIWGNLLAIPIGKSLLYAIPLYVQGSGVPIPTIYQVILANGSRVVMRPTLEQAVAALPLAAPGQASAATGVPSTAVEAPAAGAAATPAAGGLATPAELVRRANAAFERAQARQREYDTALQELGANLKQLERAVGKSP